MKAFSMLDSTEMFLVTLLIFLLLINTVSIIFSKNKLSVFSPIAFITLIYFIYTVVGPLIFLTGDFQIFPETFIRPFFTTAWQGSIVSIGFIMLGYYLPASVRIKPGAIQQYRPDKVFKVGFFLCCFGLLFYGLSDPGRMIAQINPLAVAEFEGEEHISGIANYLSASINFVIPGLCLMMLSLKKELFTTRNLIFLFILLLSFALFVSIAFRYRILVLLVALIVTYYLYKRKRPSIVFSTVVVFVCIIFIGIVGETRSYGAGLNLDKLEDKESADLLMDGFKDANIFQISGAVMRAVPSRVDYVGWHIFRNAIILPIPRSIIPNKDTDSYIRNPIKSYRPLRAISAHRWAAMLYFAEWYIAFGWVGIIGVSFILGRIYKKLWVRALTDLSNPFNIVTYAVSLGFLYIIISRGYFPFIFMSFFFLILPALMAKKLYRIKF